MGCTCTNLDDLLKTCSCGCNVCTTTTVPTTTTTTCIGEPCDEMIDPRCVIYNGPDIPCYGIKTGDSAADILDIIIGLLCPTTTTSTSTTTTTTTIPPVCNVLQFTNNTGTSQEIFWTSCAGDAVGTTILDGVTLTYCVNMSVPRVLNGVTESNIGSC